MQLIAMFDASPSCRSWLNCCLFSIFHVAPRDPVVIFTATSVVLSCNCHNEESIRAAPPESIGYRRWHKYKTEGIKLGHKGSAN